MARCRVHAAFCCSWPRLAVILLIALSALASGPAEHESSKSPLVGPARTHDNSAVNSAVSAGPGFDAASTAAASSARRPSARNDLDERRAARLQMQSLRNKSQQAFELAEKYRTGDSVAQDGKRALALYEEAAAYRAGAGSAAALSALARFYQTGWDGKSSTYELPVPEPSSQGHISGRLRRLINLSGSSYVSALGSKANATALTGGRLLVHPSMEKAVALWTEAAELGNATAQFIMGVLHAHGLFGIPLDSARSLTLYTFAALGGNDEARMVMGFKHETGQGAPKDCAASVAHYLKPAQAAADCAEASRGLGLIVPAIHRDRLSDEVLEGLAGEVHKVDTGMVSYYHNAAEKGDVTAHVALGHLYLLGARGAEQNYTTAAEHFLAAAEQGDAVSKANLAFLYLHGLGVEKDITLARVFADEVAEREGGMAAASNTLGVIYASWGAYDHAYKHFRAASDGGFPDGAYNTALMHVNGSPPGGRNFQVAVQEFRRAGSAGHIPALVRLARMQAAGLGGPKDCAGAQASLHSALHRAPSTTIPLANGYRLLASGNPAGALLEYLRAAEIGLETGAWNAAYILHEGLVPSAAVAGPRAGASSRGRGGGEGTEDGAGEVELDATEMYEAEHGVGSVASMASPGQSSSSSSSTAQSGVALDAAANNESKGKAAAVADKSDMPAAAHPGSEAASTPVQPAQRSAVPGPAPGQPPSRDTPGTTRQSGGRNSMAPSVWDTLQLWRSLLGGSSVHHKGDARMQRKALRLYQRCASQGSGAAELVLGDASFYGWGGLNKSVEKAAEYYRLACAHHVAQACFNLGWMHESGMGAPPDSHLAKRYYDSTLEEQKAARPGVNAGAPVHLALWRLQTKDGMVAWRDRIIRPVLSLFGLGKLADAANGILSLPLYVPKPAPPPAKAGKGDKVDSKGNKQAKVESKAAQATATPEASAAPTPAPATATPQGIDAKAARVQQAFAKSKAARAERAKSASVVTGITAVGGHAARGLSSMVAGMAEGFAQTVHGFMSPLAYVLGLRGPPGEFGPAWSQQDSLILLACLLVIVSMGMRVVRLYRLAREVRQEQPANIIL